MKRSIKLALAAVLGLAALVLNPWFGLTGGYDYGADEMRAAIEGTWRLTVAPEGQPRREITFRIAQAGAAIQPHDAVKPAGACGHRDFVRTAGACMDYSTMSLQITLLAGGTADPTSLPSRFEVTGMTFTQGTLEADVADLSVHGRISPIGEAADIHVSGHATTGPRDLPATLQRLSR